MRRLDLFTGSGYNKGRRTHIQVLWMIASTTLVRRWWIPNVMRLQILRLFGANGVSPVNRSGLF